MPPSPAASARPTICVCRGIQNGRIDAYAAANSSDLSYLIERWHLIRGGWHSKDCSFIAKDPLAGKPRCPKCASTNSNIRESRYPNLFPDPQAATEARESPSAISLSPGSGDSTPPSATPDPPADDAVASDGEEKHIAELILPDMEAVRRRIEKLAGDNYVGDLEPNDELTSLIWAMKAKGRTSIDLARA